ncbi:MAG: glycosyltransferase family 39 protein [Candidatus Kaelpia imicola]|nr:glycosyltransferase family 39 protein [Candidatus Kaelpia imicola]
MKTYKKIIITITVCVVFYAINNYIWLSLNKSPSAEDEFVHLVTSLSYHIHFFEQGLKHLIEIYRHSFWPPLYYITGAIFSFLSSSNYISTVLFTNLFYFIILLISIYLTGKTLFNARSGIFSLLFISLSPTIYGCSRTFMLELALTSIVALGVYAVVSFNKSWSFKKFIYLFVVLLIGALIKWSFFIFLFPLFCSLYFSMPQKDKNKYLLLLFSAISTVIIVWYTPHHIREFLFKAKSYILCGDQESLTFLNYMKEIFFYLKIAVFQYCSLPLFLIFIFSGIYVFSFKKFQFKYSLLLTIVFPILFTSLLKSCNERHLIPLLVPVSLIAGYGLDIFWNKKVKYLFIFLIGYAFINFFLISYVPLAFGYKLLGYMPRQVEGGENSFISGYAAPSREDWKYKEILNVIEKYNKENRFDLPLEYVLISRDRTRYARFSIAYFDIINKLKNRKNIKHFFLPAINSRHFVFQVIVAENKDRFDQKHHCSLDESNQLLEDINPNWILKTRAKFEFVDEIKLPEGKTAYIYAQKLEILENEFFYVTIDNKNITLISKVESNNKFKIEFVIVEKPSVLISSTMGTCDYVKVASDKIKGRFCWRDFPHKLNFEIIKSGNEFKISAKLLDKDKEIFIILFPIEEKTEQLKYTSLKSIIQKSAFPLSVHRNNTFVIFENLKSKRNQPGFLIDIPGSICLNGVKLVQLGIKSFRDRVDFENYWRNIKRLNIIDMISE